MKRFALALIALFSFPSLLTAETEGAFGLFNSPKGFGASYVTGVHDGSFDSFDLVADIYGFPLGRAAYYPGVRLQAFHNAVIRESDRLCGHNYLYAGVGMSAGYVRDFEKLTRWNSVPAYLSMNIGAMLCVSGQIGFRMNFGDIALDLSWQADAGLFLRKHEVYGNAMLEWYRNGLFNCYQPQLKIMWRF